ncbi:unnamed protein product [Diamesa serratosioi]
MEFIIGLSFVVVIVATCVNWFIKNRAICELNVQGAALYPFSVDGYFAIFKLGTISPEARFELLAKYCWSYPKIVKVWIGFKLVVMVQTPELIQKVLMSSACLEKFNYIYKLMELESGLISASCKNMWKAHRKFFNNCFSLKIIQSFIPSFIEMSDYMNTKLANHLNDKDFDFLPFCKILSFDILCATSLGMDMKTFRQTPLYEKVFQAYDITEKAMYVKTSRPFIYPQTLYKLTKLFKKERESQQILKEFSYDVLERRREFLKLQSEFENEENSFRNILIDNILLNEDKFTAKEIKDHILTFVSGYETWAVGLAHTILMLAMNPDVQEKCFHEIKNVFHSEDVAMNQDSLNSCKYLDLVQKEVLRLLPAVPIVLRETLEDFELEEGLVIPKGVNFFINFFVLHRNPVIWGKNAEQFNPDNFLPENISKRPTFSYLPFSAGQRNCIAYSYTLLSLKIALVNLLKTYKFSTSLKMEELQFKSYISLKLCSEHLVKINKR